MGTVVSALGIYLSVKLDLPTGATMVCTFGLVLILMAAVRPLLRGANQLPGQALSTHSTGGGRPPARSARASAA